MRIFRYQFREKVAINKVKHSTRGTSVMPLSGSKNDLGRILFRNNCNSILCCA